MICEKDYEEELSKKRNVLELVEENRKMKSQIEEMQAKLTEFADREAYISKALVRAEQKAQAIIEEGRQKASAGEMYRIELEKINGWNDVKKFAVNCWILNERCVH